MTKRQAKDSARKRPNRFFQPERKIIPAEAAKILGWKFVKFRGPKLEAQVDGYWVDKKGNSKGSWPNFGAYLAALPIASGAAKLLSSKKGKP